MIKTPLSTVIGGAFWTPGATVIGGNTPTFDQQIQKLFANGEQGFVYDPNDLSTMYQDAAGSVPVTAVGQPVGLMLDKSKGLTLGSELFVNPTMSGQWVSMGGGVYECVDPIGNSDLIINTGMAGKFYVIEFEILFNSVAITAYPFVGAPTTITQTGVFKYIRLATTSQFMLRVSAGRSARIRLITAKEIAGNHANQSTSAARPILRDTPRRIDFDAVDDKLITNLPAQLTGCTVVRSAPNVGTQILTGQTIPATYEDNKDHCGLLVINRVLTPSETSAITAEFNKRAGV